MITPQKSRIKEAINNCKDEVIIQNGVDPLITIKKRDLYALIACGRVVLATAEARG